MKKSIISAVIAVVLVIAGIFGVPVLVLLWFRMIQVLAALLGLPL
jgi:hypothetical protein